MLPFLRRCALTVRSLSKAGRPPVTFVIGNEGGDMDSVVGAVFLSYLLAELRHRSHSAVPRDFVPLLNFPIEDVPLRGDVAALLEYGGIDYELLASCHPGASSSLNVIDLKAHFECAGQHCGDSVVLYDHNRLTLTQEFLHPHVAGVVDHHYDEGLYISSISQQRDRVVANEGGEMSWWQQLFRSHPDGRVIAVVGSACTLVEVLYHGLAVRVPDPQLLLAPITMDTMNFNPTHKKTTSLDEVSRDRLLALVAQEEHTFPPPSFDFLNSAKYDVRRLTVPQTLRRDYKTFTMRSPHSAERHSHIGISSVLLLQDAVEELYGMDGWVAGVSEFRRSQGVDILLVMHAGEHDGSFTRQLSAFCTTEWGTSIDRFAERGGSALGLRLRTVTVPTADGWQLRSYSQADATMSRKQLVPLLDRFLSEVSAAYAAEGHS